MSAEWFDAIDEGNLESLERCLAKGVGVDSLNERGSTALTVAAAGGHAELVRWLLVRGADANFVNDAGLTVVFAAAFGQGGSGGNPVVLKAILDASDTVNLLVHTGQSVLALAIGHEKTDLVPILLEGGQIPIFGERKARARCNLRHRWV